jgi:peroxiredoxin
MIAAFLLHKLRSMGAPAPRLLQENTPAPDFELPDETGKIHRLSDYRGKKVVLWFYVRAMTPG